MNFYTKAQFIVTGNSITVLINNRPEIIDNTHPNFKAVENALKTGASEKAILELMNVSIAVQNFGEGKVTVKDGQIMYLGEVVHSALATRIISLMEQGFDISPFTRFMENLFDNPSNRAVNETYGFLEACNLPITEDGCFLAYKKVKDNYNDCYTNTINNAIGETPEVPRNKVDEDSNRTCSYGLHVASYSYMAHYPGERIMICKVNPGDVVAVPSDYNNAKMRVCKYEVINEVDIQDEQIPENVVKDEDAYDSSLRPFKTIDEALMAIRQDSFKEILERLKVTGTDSSDDLMKFDLAFTEIDNRTKNWRNQILDIFSPIEASEPYETDEPDEGDHEPECYEDYDEENEVNLTDEDELLSDIANISFYEIKEIYGTGSIISKALGGITNSTYMWRKFLTDVVQGDNQSEFYTKTDAEDVEKFSETLENFLNSYETPDWEKLTKFFSTVQGTSVTSEFIKACIDLRDMKTLIKKIKKDRKTGAFKKKALLKAIR